MVHALQAKIDAGNLQLYCVDSVDAESWYNRGVHPHERVARHIAYENYVLFEVVPLMKKLSGASRISTTGCSFGGFHCTNLTLRHPDVVSYSVSMSGAFDLKPFMNGYYDNDFYFNNPTDYVPNMNDAWFLEQYKNLKLVLAVGDHDICLGANFHMAEILGQKKIPHWLDVWTGGLRHDWPLWQAMANKFF
jgi:esterase/lipase superfamily enzyme